MTYIVPMNWLAIIIATLVAFVIGGLWYGPLFGKAWMHALGKTEADIEPTPTPFIVSFCTAFITAVTIAILLHNLRLAGVVDGALLGALSGVGFIATAMASDSAFCGWGVKLFAIQAGYRVLYSVVIGALLGGWDSLF